MQFSSVLFIVLLHFATIIEYSDGLSEDDCHGSCVGSNGETFCTGETEYDCAAPCPSYNEEGPPVLILGGVGLYVSDEDLNDMFMMQSAAVEIFPQDTNDFNDIILNATYLQEGITSCYSSEEGVLLIEGEASVEIYQSILRNISIVILNDEPDAIDRVICFTIFDGEQWSDPSCVTLQIILVNDNTPSFSVNATSSNYVEGAEEGLLLLEELEITDPDDEQLFPMQSAKINVLEWCGDTDLITVDTSGTNINLTIEGGCIILDGNDTLENYTRVFLSSKYSNSADEPNVDQSRTIMFSLFDGNNEGMFNITISLEPVNDYSTEIIINPSKVNVSESEASMGVQLSIVSNLILRDNDTNDDVYVKKMAIKIENAYGFEKLVISDVLVTGNGTDEITIAGNNSLSYYQDMLNAVHYVLTSDEPPCQKLRTINVTINNIFSDTLVVEIIPVNDNVPNVTFESNEIDYYENMVLYPLSGIKITDGDNCALNTLYMVRVTFSDITDDEKIKFGDFPWLNMDSSVCGDENIEIDSTDTSTLYSNIAALNYFNCSATPDYELMVVGKATIEQYMTLLKSLEYNNIATEPPEIVKTVMVYANNSEFESNEAVLTIETYQVNDEPPFVDTNGTTFEYIEDSNFTIIIVGPFATIRDDDGNITHQTVSHFCITIENSKPEDNLYLASDKQMYEIALEADFGSGEASGLQSGLQDTERLCVNVSSCNNNFTDSSCFYSFLSAVTFSVTEDEPNLESRNISFTAYSDKLHRTTYVTVEIVPVNDQPHTLYLNATSINYSVDFFEGSEAVRLSSGLNFVDIDVGDKEFTSASIDIIINAEKGDQIALNDSLANELGLNATVMMDGQFISIDGVASQMAYAELLATVTYINSMDEPTPVEKIIKFTVNDLERDAIANVTVTLYPVNDPPELPVVTIVFNESTRDPVYLFTSEIEIDDSDNNTLEWIRIRIEPVDFLDNLTLFTDSIDNINFTLGGGDSAPKTSCFPAENNETTQTIKLYGPASTEDFNNAIRNITFSNVCPGLNISQRSIEITLFDGVDEFVSWVYVNISAIDDVPVCYFGQWPGVTTSSHMYIEQLPQVSLADNFIIIDNDGPIHYMDGVTITLSRIRDEGEESLNFTLSNNVLLTVQTVAAMDGYYTSVYELTNGESFEEYQQVVKTMKYINNALEPSTFLPRVVTITINDTEFIDCSIEVTVINTPDRPVITIQDDYQSDFIEDSPFTLISDSANITVADEDSVFLYQARMEILNTPTEYGTIIDTIILPASHNDQFDIEGNGTSSIIATSKSLNLHHIYFVQLIKSLEFQTDDQSTNITRQISVVVEEFPLNEPGPSLPILIPVNIIQRNDRPVFLSPLISEQTLDSFIPPETANPGFFPSALADKSVVDDPDCLFPYNPDFIGLSIFNVNNDGIGEWQYMSNGSEGWKPLNNTSPCESVFLNNNDRIRFLPSIDIVSEMFGTPFFNYSVWDGTSTDICNGGDTIISDQNVSVSVNESSFLYIVIYNAPILLTNAESDFTFTEGSDQTPMIFRNISVTASAITKAMVEIQCDLCTEPVSGFEKIESDLSNFSIQMNNSTHLGIASFVILSNTSYMNVQHLEDFLKSLKYINAAVEPEPVTRTITLSVTDDLTVSDGVTVTVLIEQINDNMPEINLLPELTITEVEAENGVLLFTNVTDVIMDADYGLELVNVSVSLNSLCDLEMLWINASAFSLSINASLNSIYIEGPASLDKFNEVLRSILYVTLEEEPVNCTTSTVQIEAFDGIFESSKSQVISISPSNDNLPDVTVINDTFQFTELGPAIYPLQTISLNDADVPDTPVVLAEIELINPLDDGEKIQILEVYDPMNEIMVNYINHSIIITSTGNGVNIAILQDNIRRITYININSNPNTTQRIISLTVTDLLYPNQLMTTDPIFVYIDVTAIDNPPSVILNQESIVYVGQLSGTVPVVPNAVIVDPDSVQIGGLNMYLVGNVSISENDKLNLNESLIPVGVNMNYSSISNLETIIVIELNGVASIVEYTALLRSLTYENDDFFPDAFGTRFLVVLPFSIENEFGLGDSIEISYGSINPTPVVDLNGPSFPTFDNNVQFIEGSMQSLPLAKYATIADMDDDGEMSNIVSVHITLAPHADGEMEFLTIITNEDIELVWITPGSSFMIVGKLDNTSINSFTQTLRTLAYSNNAVEPSSFDRQVSVIANDGGIDSNTAITTISIMNVNDPPIIDLNENINFVYNESGGPVNIIVDPILIDVDSNVFTAIRIFKLVNVSGDVISSDYFSYESIDDFYTFQFNNDSDFVISLLKSITFSSALDEPSTEKREYCVSVKDEADWSEMECVMIITNFQNITASVAEKTPNTNVIELQMFYFDDLNTSNYKWSITAGDECHDDQSKPCIFQIDNNGLLKTSSTPPDREKIDQYMLTVTVADNGFESSTVVTITVLDINDNSPMITGSSTINIDEHRSLGTVIETISVVDNDINENAESYLSLISGNDYFTINQNGVISVVGDIDYDSGIEYIILSVLANNTAAPHNVDIYNATVTINNINDNAPIIVFETGEVSFIEKSDYSVLLDVGVTIVDDDGRSFTSIYDGKVELINPDTREPSTPFIPTSNDNPSECLLEDKVEKIIGCGLTESVMIPSSNFNDGGFDTIVLDENTLVFIGSESQFGEERASLSDVTSTDELSILAWIWYTPTNSSSTIFAHTMRTTGLISYGAICSDANDLEFYYHTAGVQKNHSFADACNMLTSQWHHLAIIILSTVDGTQVNIFIDGSHHDNATITQPEDQSNDRLYIGARPVTGDSSPMRDFFTGRIHRMVISSSVAFEPHINCIIGCGIYIYSSQLYPLLPYSYDYTTRTFFAEGIRNISVYENFLDSLIFVNAFTEPRQLSYDLDYTVTDGGFNCIPVQLNISISPSNDGDPMLSLNGPLDQDYSSVYVEEQGPVSIVNASSLSLTDIDLLPYPYEIVATITDPQQSSNMEILAVSNLPNGMTQNYSNYILSVEGLFTIDVFETVLQTLTYDNLADEPIGSTRTVSVIVNDDFEGSRKSNLANSAISFVFVNDPPIINISLSTPDYYEGNGIKSIFQNTLIADSDNMTLVSATISLELLGGDNETIGINTTLTNITHMYNTSVDEITITLVGDDIVNSYENVINSLTYSNSEDNITEGERIFSFIFFDGVSYSEIYSVSLYVYAVNDRPVIDINGMLQGNVIEVDFVEDVDFNVSVVSDQLTISDLDNNTLVGAYITFVNRPDGDWEYVRISIDLPFSVQNDSSDVFSITPLSGTASLIEFEEMLKTLQYVNTAEEPTPGNHNLEITVDDGQDASLASFITVTVISMNDPPYLDLDNTENETGFSNTFTENGPAVSISSDNVQITDNDVDSLISYIQVVIQNPEDGSDESVISFNPNISINVSMTNGSQSTFIISNPDETLMSAASIIVNLAYINNADEPSSEIRYLDISVYDDIAYSNVATIEIMILQSNDYPPVFEPQETLRVYENSPIMTNVGQVIATDGDSGTAGNIVYSLIEAYPSNGLDHFSIGKQSGVIIAVIELDRENISLYSLTVEASDLGNPPKTAQLNVTVIVLGRNDNKPMFPEDVYYAMVSESAAPGTTIAMALAIDHDDPETVPIYSIMGVSNYFIVDPTGNIIVAQNLDAESIMFHNITIFAEDFGGMFDTAVYEITVLDVNDNMPIFEMTSYDGSVPENLVNGEIAIVTASDADVSNNSITYSFENNSTLYSMFAIDKVTGLITTTQLLDREEQSVYTLTVLAVDDGYPLQLTGNTTVTVTVLDKNDNSPIFGQLSYNISIQEHGFDTLRVSATDLDLGVNGSVNIDLVNKSDPFLHTVINSGSVFDIVIEFDGIDFEITKIVTAQIVASDNGLIPLTSSVPLMIFVVDINDNQPIFYPTVYAGEAPENVVNYDIISVNAYDLDSGVNGEVRYGLESYETDFDIDEITGNITTIRELDFEMQCFYQLQVIAYDMGIVRSTSTVTVDIAITASNDEPPNFNQSVYYGSVIETLNSDPYIGPVYVTQVFAFDDDSSVCKDVMAGSGSGNGDNILELTNVTYSLLNHYNDFEIDSNTGVVTAVRNFDREAVPQYTLIVSAIDSSSLSSNVTVIVNILDINDNSPVFLVNMYKVSIPESFPINVPFIQVVATDMDNNDSLQYSIINDNNGIFGIDGNSGNISLSSEIDFESQIIEYIIYIKVEDTNNNVDFTQVTVSVEDANDSPPKIITISTVLTFMEGQVSLIPFTELSINDSDTLPNIVSAVISLSSPEENINDNSNCYCSNTSDALSCAEGCQEFLYISNNSFPGDISVSEDGYTITLSGSFMISVYESAIKDIYYINVISNPMPDNRNISVFVNDGKLNSNILTNMIQMILLNQFPPVIDLNGPIDNVAGYTVNFTEEGSAVYIASQTAVITDNDIVSVFPMITMMEIWIDNPIDENEETLELVPDFDIPNELTLTSLQYRLVITGTATNESYVSVIQQVQYLNNALEPTPTERLIKFRATEYHLTSEIATTVVTIITINDNAPNLLLNPPSSNNYDIDYRENDGQIQLVPSIAYINDDDSSEDYLTTMQVSVLAPGEFDLISIVNSTDSNIITQQLSQTSLLFTGSSSLQDYQDILKRIYYSFTADEFTISEVALTKYILIQIADGSFSSFSIARLVLIPENDQQPTLHDTMFIANVSENATVGDTVIEFVASDGDTYSESQVRFSISSGNDDGFFTINADTGAVTIDKNLDFEQNMVHMLTVLVEDVLYDTGSDAPFIASLEIVIGDVNDNVPQFNQSLYNVDIKEDVVPETFVLQVVAIDFDSNIHSQLVYSIIGTSDFNINSNGIITTAMNLDYENIPQYVFNITVRNPGSQKKDNAQVIINVEDVDDNPPMLLLVPESATLVEPETVLQLAQSLSISDLDTLPTLNMASISIISGPGYLVVPNIPDDIVANGNNTQIMTFIGIASLSVYESMLRSVFYVDMADEPMITERVLVYQVFSGQFNASDSFKIYIDSLNDHAPVLLLTSNSSKFFTNFAENGNPILLSNGNISITDGDDFGMISYAIVDLVAFDGSDEIVQVTLSNGLILDSSSSEQLLIITGDASLDVYQTVLSTVTYVNTAEEPTVQTRTVTFIVNDGIFNSTQASAFITIISVNDAPMLTLESNSLGTELTYIEGQPAPLVLAPNLEIIDVDSELLTAASVFLIDPTGEEILNVTLSSQLMQITTTNDMITLSASSGVSIDTFKDVLKSVTYFTTRQTPFPSPRQVTFTVVDADGALSATAIAIIMFNSSDTSPVLDLNGPLLNGVNYTTSFNEDTVVPIRIVSDDVSIIDNDSDMVTSLTVIIAVTHSGDVFMFPEHTNLSKSEDNNVIVYTGLQPFSVYINLLLSFQFTNELEEHSDADRQILFKLSTQANGLGQVSSNTAATTISIVSINDQAPVFDQDVYHGFVLENSITGTSTGVVVLAVDNDVPTNSEITYYIENGSFDFQIDISSGAITTLQPLDADNGLSQIITFVVIAEDNVNGVILTASTVVNITIGDINDNPPMFESAQYDVTIEEGASVGTLVLDLNATDNDRSVEHSTIVYMLNLNLDSGSGSGMGMADLPFVIDAASGIITVSDTLDAELVSSYTFGVTTSDGVYEDQTNVTVTVTNINDNTPMFIDEPYTTEVSENVEIENTVFNVKAIDLDLNDNLMYYIEGTTVFNINQFTGDIFVAMALDYESQTSIEFTVVATDSGSLNTSAVVIISILNVNDNPPVFTQPSYQASFPENSLFNITMPSAVDADGDTITYTIVSSCNNGFEIDTNSGAIVSTQTLDRETFKTCQIVVSATDQTFITEVIVTVNVEDLNDNAPIFDQTVYQETVPEGIAVGTKIATVSASDSDEGSNSDVSYTLLSNTNTFNISASTGDIYLISQLDFEAIASYSISVKAQDGGVVSNSAMIDVQIIVNNTNDEEPTLFIAQTNVVYTEESGIVPILSDVQIIDPDMKFLVSAKIVMTIPDCSQSTYVTCIEGMDCSDSCGEAITIDNSGLEVVYYTDNLALNVNITGEGSVSQYQSIISSLNYVNNVEEPIPGIRTVTVSVRDGFAESNTLVINVSVVLIDDHCPIITLLQDTLSFIEESETQNVGTEAGLFITDNDRAPHQYLSSIRISVDGLADIDETVLINSSLSTRNQNTLTIIIDQVDDIATYNSLLQTLLYSNPLSEPTAGLRVFNITLINEQMVCSSTQFSINVVLLNDNSPVLTLESSSTLDYVEESGSLMVGVETGLRLTDEDSTFLINYAQIYLQGASNALEQLSLNVNEPVGINIVSDSSAINITGDASVSVYENLLRSISYLNQNTEPASGIRTIVIIVNDGDFEAKVDLSINVIGANDNPIFVTSNTSSVSFIEGMTSLSVGQLANLVISDIDEQPMVHSLTLVLGNVLESDKERLSIESFGELVTDGQVIFINQTDSLLIYQNILSTLTYIYNSDGDEPLPGIRTITILVHNGLFTASLDLQVSVEIINDHAPVLSFNGSSTIQYNENSGELTVGALFLPVIYDEDSNTQFLMANATIQLGNGVDGVNEQLNVDSTIVPNVITVQVSQHLITLIGEATISEYQLALRAITYQNTASEPSQVDRIITYQVSDDTFNSNSLIGNIVIGLIDDNDLVISCSSESLVYTEQGTSITIGSSLMLSDLDIDHQIFNSTITITNPQNGDQLSSLDSVNSDLTVTPVNNGYSILINGVSTASEYQELLQSISYSNNANEPDDTKRIISFTIYQLSSSVTCSVTINIQLINDNIPVVDLSGPDDSTINQTTQINFNYLYLTQVAISSQDATITDVDADSIIQNLTATLQQKRMGDRLLLNPDICSYEFTAATTMCFINVSMPDDYSCMCGQSNTTADLIVTVTPTVITVTQTISDQAVIQLALRGLVFFQHSPDVPESSYTSTIDVIVNDGLFTSLTATTEILIEYQNTPPTVFIDSQQQMTTGEAEMSDGQTTVTLTPNILVTDDSNNIAQVVIQLTNPIHPEDERINLTIQEGSLIQLSDISNSTYLILTGNGTLSAYSSVLKTLQFTYLKMASLLEQQPNVTDRIVTITAVDNNQAIGQSSTVSIIFNRACTIWSSVDSVIRIPIDLSVEELGICTSVAAFHIRIADSNAVQSLLPLKELESVDSMSLISLPDLESLEGLENLGYFTELVIDHLDSLISMDSFGSNLPNDHRINAKSIVVRNSGSLTNIDGMRIIENATNLVQIQNCDILTDLSGLDNLVFAGTVFLVELPMTKIVSFKKLFEVSDLWIYNNKQLQSITGFQNLRRLELLNMITNGNLFSIDGLSGVGKVDVVRSFMNFKLCHIGEEITNAGYWQALGAQTIGDFDNVCTNRNCSDTPCLNNGQCIDTDQSYECQCGDLYFGSNCQYYDECNTSPCQNGGSCSTNINIDTVEQYTCSCPNGISGFNCDMF